MHQNESNVNENFAQAEKELRDHQEFCALMKFVGKFPAETVVTKEFCLVMESYRSFDWFGNGPEDA